MTTPARDLKFSPDEVQRSCMVMVALTQKSFLPQHAWFSRGRSHIREMTLLQELNFAFGVTKDELTDVKLVIVCDNVITLAVALHCCFASYYIYNISYPSGTHFCGLCLTRSGACTHAIVHLCEF